MTKFNTILESAGVDPGQTKLVRHKAEGSELTLYQFWLSNKDGFEKWQRFQARPVFSGAATLASFVKTPLQETVFAGLYSVNAVGDAPDGLRDPFTGKEVGEYNTVTGKYVGRHKLYDLSPMLELADHQGRIVVDWGPGYRTWVQWAHKQNKTVHEIRRAGAQHLRS